MSKDTLIGALVTAVIFVAGIAIWQGVAKPKPHIPTDQIVANSTQNQTPSTQSNSAPTTLGKTTYSDNQYGFSFIYPSTMKVENIDGPTPIPGRKFLIIHNNESPFDRLEISVSSSAYGASAGREACGQGYDNQTYSNVTINGLNFTKGEVGSAYQGMNSGKINATAYCYTDSTTGNQYVLSHVGTPSTAIQSIINSFKLK